MARAYLKRLLSKGRINLTGFAERFCIRDAEGKFLLGVQETGTDYPIISNEITYGWVSGDSIAI